MSMDTTEHDTEEAYFFYMEARQAALQAAIGYFITDQVPRKILHIISASTTNEMIKLAAEMVLWETRGAGPAGVMSQEPGSSGGDGVPPSSPPPAL